MTPDIYTRPEVNERVIRAAAKMLLDTGATKDVARGVRCLRDLLITTVQMRRKHLRNKKLQTVAP